MRGFRHFSKQIVTWAGCSQKKFHGHVCEGRIGMDRSDANDAGVPFAGGKIARFRRCDREPLIG